MDSRRWSQFPWRDDDIVISTWAKSGTTWLQQILGQLIHKGKDDVVVYQISPWWEMRVFPIEDAIKGVEEIKERRFIKTHLPSFAFPTPPKQQKMIFVGRDGRDAVWSYHNHHSSSEEPLYKALNETPGLVGPPLGQPKEDKVEYFKDFLYGVEGKRGTVDLEVGYDPFGEGYPLWPFFDFIKSWYEAAQTNPNIYLLHFNDLKRDFKGEIQMLADFLELPLENEEIIAEHCTLKWMRDHGNQIVPGGGGWWKDGVLSFLNQGTNQRWKGELPEELSADYERIAEEKLGRKCAEWLTNGRLSRAS